MKILLNQTPKNYDKLEKALDDVQRIARVRTTNVEQVVLMINNVLSKFERMGIKKKNQKGIVFYLNPHAQTFAKSYKYNPQTTYVKVEIGNCPIVTRIFREECDNKTVEVYYTENAKLDILENAEKLDIWTDDIKGWATIRDTRNEVKSDY